MHGNDYVNAYALDAAPVRDLREHHVDDVLVGDALFGDALVGNALVGNALVGDALGHCARDHDYGRESYFYLLQ